MPDDVESDATLLVMGDFAKTLLDVFDRFRQGRSVDLKPVQSGDDAQTSPALVQTVANLLTNMRVLACSPEPRWEHHSIVVKVTPKDGLSELLKQHTP